MNPFNKKNLAALASALILLLCSCGNSATAGTTADTGASTGGTTSAQTSATTQNGAENPGINIPSPTVKGYLRVVDQSVFEGKVMINGKIETKIMRVAVLAAENIFNYTITYIDVIDDDGTVLASKMMGGYGFFAVSTGENTATAILRYSIDLVGDRFTLAATMGEFSNIGSDGKPMDKLSFVTHTNKNTTVSSTDDGLISAQDQIETFSREAADFIGEGADKWNVIAYSQNGSGLTANEYGEYPITSEVIEKIRSPNGETLQNLAAKHIETERTRVELAEKSEKMLNAILAGDADAAADMLEIITPENKEQFRESMEEWVSEYKAMIEGAGSFKLENYWRGETKVDGERVYAYNFKMTTEKGVFSVEVMQKTGKDKFASFYIAERGRYHWEDIPKFLE